MSDHIQQIGHARKGVRKLAKAEAQLVKATEDIADVLVQYQDLFETKQMVSVFARLDNLIKAMSEMVTDADALLDPEVLDRLRADLAEHRATIEV